MNNLNLTKASNQWAQRPADQRFWNLDDMLARATEYRTNARTATVNDETLHVEANGQDLVLVGKNQDADITHYAFGQLAQRAGAPASYLRTLPSTLAATNLNHGLTANAVGGHGNKLLLHASDSDRLALRCLSSDKYDRIWNDDLIRKITPLQADGWRTAPARPTGRENECTRIATASDVINSGHAGLSIKVGDPITPAGLYLSDQDMFAFLINDTAQISDGSDTGLYRGFFVENTELAGLRKFVLTVFLYESVCGNHIVWGASNVIEIALRHIGNASERAFAGVEVELKKYLDSPASEDENRIQAAKRFVLGKSMSETIDYVFSKSLLSRKVAEKSYTLCEQLHCDQDPNTAWGLAQGITRLSQTLGNASDRVAMDKVAGKLMEVAF